MCGIAGWFGTGTQALLDSMVGRLAHRGPDGQGSVEKGYAGIGSTRLSLIDRMGGAQPARSANGRHALVYNGELYNYAALRQRLQAAGHPVGGRSDTQVLLGALQAWGPACLAELEGMYAFAWTDGAELLLARDPFGIKPLFYALVDSGRRLIFASEIKALLEDSELSRGIDRGALLEFVVFRNVLGDKSFFRAIRQVPPGGLLHAVRQSDGMIGLDLAQHGAPRLMVLPEDEAALTTVVLERLAESVRSQQVADHPVGAFLSGGLDSSLMTALMTRAPGKDVHTFTVADTKNHPDIAASRLIASALGTRHHELIYSPAEILAELATSTLTLEGPADVTIVNVAGPAIRRHVKAVLCGDGADELFAGYPMHAQPARWVRAYAEIYNHLIRSGEIATADCAAAKAALAALLHGDEDDTRDAVYRFMLASQLTFSHLLVWDRGAMQHGLEVRVPYLDTRLRDVALALPWAWRIRGGQQKAALRRAAARVLPWAVQELVINRPKLAAPSALRTTSEALEVIARDLVPAALAARHPFRLYCRTPGTQLRLDLFIFLFIAHPGNVPAGFEWKTLYTHHAEALEAALLRAARAD